MGGLKELLASKKFWITIIGSAVCAGLNYAGVDNQIVYTIASLFGVNIGAQGFADTKKK